MRLSNKRILEYTKTYLTHQVDILLKARSIVIQNDPLIVEKIITDKWLNGYLGYYSPNNNFVYALGVLSNGKITFHMMTYYSSRTLQEKYSLKLKPYLTGKSCISFSTLDDSLASMLKEITKNGSSKLDVIVNSVKHR